MTKIVNLCKDKSETELEYIWRICQSKDIGTIDMTWDELSNVLNKNLSDIHEEWTSSAYRKKYQQAKAFHDEVFVKMLDNEYAHDLILQKQELEKERVKTRDERNELRRIIREEARKESYEEQVIRAIVEHQTETLKYDPSRESLALFPSDNDLIISLTDIHAGIEIDNYFNTFNQEILRDRLNQYIEKIIEIQLRHHSENAYIILSELVSGIIHNTLRIENNQNLIEQFLMVTDYISDFLSELNYHFDQVHVYVVPGNHSRISPKKEDSLKGENIDHLAIPMLKAKLQNFDNIKFHGNDKDESIAIFSVRGNRVMSSHGDKDSPANVVQRFTLLLDEKPDLVYLGHRHKNGMTTVYNTKVIESGCVSGVDNYAIDLRMNGNPSQTVSVVNDKGLDCLYDVTLY